MWAFVNEIRAIWHCVLLLIPRSFHDGAGALLPIESTPIDLTGKLIKVDQGQSTWHQVDPNDIYLGSS
jgi:hypothetical protein